MPGIPLESLQSFLEQHPDWSTAGGKLIRRWEFSHFAEAMTFVNQIALLAEDSNHHPDIDIRYTQVCLALISHDVGRMTQRDVAMACRIDDLFKKE